jgi:hypothetical protein
MARKFYVASLRNKAHYHGCPQCRSRFSCACDTPEWVGTCPNCRLGRTRSLLVVRPAHCCQPDNLRQVRNDERESYKLAGDHGWLICRTCFRQQPAL